MATEIHYTYITRSPDGRYYIGVRTCDGDPADDPYMGSHTDPTYEPNRKRVLATFDHPVTGERTKCRPEDQPEGYVPGLGKKKLSKTASHPTH